MHGAGLAAGGQAHVLVEGRGLHAQAVAFNGLHVLGPGDQHDLMPGARQHAAEIAADGARAHDGDLDAFVIGQEAGHVGLSECKEGKT